MSASKPLKLHYHGPSPNPWKVVIILEELSLPYDLISIPDVKGEAFSKLNPNGRAPVLEDPNIGVTLWESGSIIEYLLDIYDKSHSLSYTSSPERYLQKTWAHFQLTGQGPYFGQAVWFSLYHPEELPSAIERYVNEIYRVLGVIELHLSKTGHQYLVGDKISYADLMFVPYNSFLPRLLGEQFDQDFETRFPETYGWNARLIARQGVQRMEAAKMKVIANQPKGH